MTQTGEFVISDDDMQAFRNRPLSADAARRLIADDTRKKQTASGKRLPRMADSEDDDDNNDDDVVVGLSLGSLVSYCSIEEADNIEIDADEFMYDDDEEFARDSHSYCYLCKVADDAAQKSEAGKAHAQLLTMISRMYWSVSNIGLARGLQKHYNTRLRHWTRTRRPWRQRVIIAHIEEHAPTAFTMIAKDMRTLHSMTNIMRRNCLVTRLDGGGRPKYGIDVNNAKLLCTLMQTKHKCMQMLPELSKKTLG